MDWMALYFGPKKEGFVISSGIQSSYESQWSKKERLKYYCKVTLMYNIQYNI